MIKLQHRTGVALVNPKYVASVGSETQYGYASVWVSMAHGTNYVTWESQSAYGDEVEAERIAEWERVCKLLGYEP